MVAICCCIWAMMAAIWGMEGSWIGGLVLNCVLPVVVLADVSFAMLVLVPDARDALPVVVVVIVLCGSVRWF